MKNKNLDLNTMCYIREQTSFSDDYKGNFGYTKTTSEYQGRFYVTFEAVLQSFGVMNRNKRCYDANNIMSCINRDEFVQDQLQRKQWIGEIDHPASDIIGQELSMNRITVPKKEMSSHYIRNPRLDGNLLKATIQSDSGTEHGMNMATSVVDAGIIPAFSARVLGSLRNQGGRPTVDVKRVITYDWVMFPSHKDALAEITLRESADELSSYTGDRIVFLRELAQQAANNSKETEFICESFGLDINSVIGLTSDAASVVISEGKNLYVQPLVESTIRARTKNAMIDWLNG